MSGLHEETSEEDLVEHFMDAGSVKNSYLNLDRRTGFAKGYALIEYETETEALVSHLSAHKLCNMSIRKELFPTV